MTWSKKASRRRISSWTSDTGEQVKLSDFRGRPVVLYFYPKDDTPGCTKQACDIRDEYAQFKERGAVVLGVSPDDEASHVKFRDKYRLPFTLLADPEHEAAEPYGVWGEKNFGGKKYMGINRSTFVIDADGNVLESNARREGGHPRRKGAGGAPQASHLAPSRAQAIRSAHLPSPA